MAKYRSKRFDDVLGQTVVPQADRYLGNDVLGMEETPARPMGYETGADPAVRMPGRARTFWNEKTMETRSTTNGKASQGTPVMLFAAGILTLGKK